MRLGEHTISTEIDCDIPMDPTSCSTDNPPFQDFEISRKIVPEDYREAKQGYDIALLLLKTEVKFKNILNIETICLPVYPSQNIDSIKLQERGNKFKMIVSGWGLTENRTKADILQQTAISYADSSACEQIYQKEFVNTNPSLKIHTNQLVNIFNCNCETTSVLTFSTSIVVCGW